MKEQAIQKIQAEMEQNKANAYVQEIGKFLIKYLVGHPDAAEKVMNQDKTIRKSLFFMRDEAKKKQVEGVAMLTPAEGFSVVLKYYGIEENGIDLAAAPPTPPAAKPADDFNINLDDFLTEG
jgi:hypothetical protein